MNTSGRNIAPDSYGKGLLFNVILFQDKKPVFSLIKEKTGSY
jgi:hypothetical protein